MSELEELLGHLQLQNQQLQTIIIQKQSLLIQDKEIEKALEEMEKCGDEIYKSVGPILVKTNKEDMRNELKEERDDISIKLKSIEKQEKRIRDAIKDSQEKFQSMIPKQGG